MEFVKVDNGYYIYGLGRTIFNLPVMACKGKIKYSSARDRFEFIPSAFSLSFCEETLSEITEFMKKLERNETDGRN